MNMMNQPEENEKNKICFIHSFKTHKTNGNMKKLGFFLHEKLEPQLRLMPSLY
jgi:hypothetical protein